MFNKMKQFKDMRSQAKTMQSALAQETVTANKKGVTVTMNGNLEITKVVIDPNLSREEIEKNVMDSVNEANKKTQKLMAQKMQQMGGLPGLTQ